MNIKPKLKLKRTRGSILSAPSKEKVSALIKLDYGVPKEINLSCEFLEDELAIKIDGKKYYWQNPPKERIYTDPWSPNGKTLTPIPEGNRNHFRTGMRNIFLWSEGEDFGYKIFSRGENTMRRIYKILYNKRKFERFRLNNESIKILHYCHNHLHSLNLTPDSLCIVNFNNEFQGLKVQRIKGPSVASLWHGGSRGRTASGDWEPNLKGQQAEEIKERHGWVVEHGFPIKALMREMYKIGLATDFFQMGLENYKYDEKESQVYFVDLEYKHIRHRQDLLSTRFCM